MFVTNEFFLLYEMKSFFCFCLGGGGGGFGGSGMFVTIENNSHRPGKRYEHFDTRHFAPSVKLGYVV